MERETEFKALLTKEQFDEIKEMFEFGEPKKQINHYYMDGNELLEEKKITVRVREKESGFSLQVKVFRAENEGVVFSEEYKKKLLELPEVIFPDILPVDIGVYQPLEYIGALTTLRSVCKKENYEICLDENRYLGKVDYELEIEYEGEMPSDIYEKINSVGVPSNSASGKRARFSEALKNGNGTT